VLDVDLRVRLRVCGEERLIRRGERKEQVVDVVHHDLPVGAAALDAFDHLPFHVPLEDDQVAVPVAELEPLFLRLPERVERHDPEPTVRVAHGEAHVHVDPAARHRFRGDPAAHRPGAAQNVAVVGVDLVAREVVRAEPDLH
jgi:hypothetical protein